MSAEPHLDSVFIDPPATGPVNMALDAALLGCAQSSGLRALRLYGWDPGTLSFGRHEPALRRYDRGEIERRGLGVVRRPTGGRAVWHQREVTYAIAAPTAAFGSLRESYLAIHALIAEALGLLGAKVVLAGERPPLAVGAGACFAAPAGGEVVTLSGRKVVGSAQVRAGDAFLQHGSILLVAEQDVVAGLTRGDADPPSQSGLAELVDASRATFDAVCDATLQVASRCWGAPARAGPTPESVRHRARELECHFADDGWTWRR